MTIYTFGSTINHWRQWSERYKKTCGFDFMFETAMNILINNDKCVPNCDDEFIQNIKAANVFALEIYKKFI